MKKKTFTVTLTHPTGYHQGSHTVNVMDNGNGTMYCTAGGFGCSRDYYTEEPKEALRLFFAEHACKVQLD